MPGYRIFGSLANNKHAELIRLFINGKEVYMENYLSISRGSDRWAQNDDQGGTK